MIYIVGIGPGHKDYILPKAWNTIAESDIVIGFKRALDSLELAEDKKKYMQKLSDLDEYILKPGDKNISITASGDPTFYGITNYIKNKAEVDFEVIPGISSFQYLTSKIKMPWNNAYLGSLHGRNEEFIENVKKHDISIWLTDNINTPSHLSEILIKEEVKCSIIVGADLSYEDEVICRGLPEEILNKEFSSLSIFIVIKEN